MLALLRRRGAPPARRRTRARPSLAAPLPRQVPVMWAIEQRQPLEAMHRGRARRKGRSLSGRRPNRAWSGLPGGPINLRRSQIRDLDSKMQIGSCHPWRYNTPVHRQPAQRTHGHPRVLHRRVLAALHRRDPRARRPPRLDRRTPRHPPHVLLLRQPLPPPAEPQLVGHPHPREPRRTPFPPAHRTLHPPLHHPKEGSPHALHPPRRPHHHPEAVGLHQGPVRAHRLLSHLHRRIPRHRRICHPMLLWLQERPADHRKPLLGPRRRVRHGHGHRLRLQRKLVPRGRARRLWVSRPSPPRDLTSHPPQQRRLRDDHLVVKQLLRPGRVPLHHTNPDLERHRPRQRLERLLL